jgi:hypothetical protein
VFVAGPPRAPALSPAKKTRRRETVETEGNFFLQKTSLKAVLAANMSVVVLFLLLACSCNAESEHELTMHTFEGHTPESYRWEFANASCVVGERSTDPGVWHYGKTDNAQECQDACAKNASCIAFDWCVGQRPKAKKSKCSRHHNCWFRADTKWDLGQGGSCLGELSVQSLIQIRTPLTAVCLPLKPKHQTTPAGRRSPRLLPPRHLQHLRQSPLLVISRTSCLF